MTLPSPTGQRALDVPATPSSPVTEASIARAPQVLTQAPLGTAKKPKDRLVLVGTDTGSITLITQYYAQVYRWPASTIVPVSSWDDVVRELAACSSIGELVIFSHATYSAVMLGGQQLTASQFADRFAPVAPPIGSLAFDGCVIGSDLEGMHAIATRMKIPYVRGWTYWHYIDWWRMVPTGDPAASLALFQPLGTFASPWLPKSLDGKQVFSLSEQEPLFSSQTLNLAGEYFVYSYFDKVAPDFVTAVQGSKLDSTIHRARGTAEERLVDSAGGQGTLDAEIRASRPLFARVVMTPWI